MPSLALEKTRVRCDDGFEKAEGTRIKWDGSPLHSWAESKSDILFAHKKKGHTHRDTIDENKKKREELSLGFTLRISTPEAIFSAFSLPQLL